jgi:8-oxo-dGTP pyrophosphatase MutT (NUDIX family)
MPGQQRIPRPDSARPGGAPPWSDVPHGRRKAVTLDAVRAAMATMGPAQPWPPAVPASQMPFQGDPAAVLVPLFEEDGQARVILTRRSSKLRSHTSEVSFPGGRLEPDESPLAAALREAGEEIGLNTEDVEILGQLEPLATLSSRSGITPFVGVLPGRPELHPNPHEVEHAFDVALVELMDERVYREERWDTPWAEDRPVHFFDLPHDIVWGATARILHQLLELIVVNVLNGRTG